MTKNLVIVESPAKSRTLKKFLGGDYRIEASLGHIRDLKKKEMGIGANYEPLYQILPDKQDVVKRLRQAAKGADMVYLAPDPDREGEAIAWHISEVLDKNPEQVRRVAFNEITRAAVLRALEHPGAIDFRKVEAQQTRRVLDRMMGFRLSPMLWEKVKTGLSAGRVQSVALKMICDRQEEIDRFQPEEYWLIGVRLEGEEPPPFLAKLHQIEGRKAKVGNGEQAAAIVAALDGGSYRVKSVERKESRQHPAPPFITSRLQQEASRRYGFPVKKTMALAQGLYEGREIGDRGSIGLITYMRTDSTRIAEEALAAVREVISRVYGPGRIPEAPNRYRSKKGAQDAHEAIRPTTLDLPPEAVQAYLKGDEWKLYKLIWDRFVASQMLPAVFDVTQADIENGSYVLRATGRVMKSPGFLAVYQEVTRDAKGGNGAGEEDEDSGVLPALAEGQELTSLGVASEQKFTQPPAQFSEATLVRALEENGIGRPSTYASILSTLGDRDYTEQVARRFRPTALGKLVNRLLQQGFSDVINEGYTAALEVQLDRIEDGEINWKDALLEFDEKFTRDLATAGESLPNLRREGLPLDPAETCPLCGSGQLTLRAGRYGTFIGCDRYPECRYRRSADDPPAAAEEGDGEAQEAPTCELCGRPMVQRRSRFGVFWGCSGYPECTNILRTGAPGAEPKDSGVVCAECGQANLFERRSRRGKVFYSCGRYPACKFAVWNRPIPEPCPSCGAAFVTEKTTKKLGLHRVCVREGCGWKSEAIAEEK